MNGKTYTREGFVKEFSPYANTITKGTGILPGTLLSQGILESSGNYNTPWAVGGSKLSQEANNYFGIKAQHGDGWTGKVYNISTREVFNGKSVYEKDDFRKYDSVKDSMADYVQFLLKNPRYREHGVFNAKTVPDQAKALKAAGYATAPDYASVVNGVYDTIKKYISLEYDPVFSVVKKHPFVTILALLGVAGLITTFVIASNSK